MRKQEENIIPYSERVRDIISSPPHSSTELGTYIVLVIIASLLILANWIKVKEESSIPVTILAENPPFPILAPVSGKLTIIVKNGDPVTKNQTLALLETDSITQTLVRSPINGNITYGPHVRGNILSRKDSLILYVAPKNHRYFGIFYIEPENINQLEDGKKLKIILESGKENREYYLEGIVENIPTLPIYGRKNLIYIEILPNSTRQVKFAHNSIGYLQLSKQPESLLSKFWHNTFKQRENLNK